MVPLKSDVFVRACVRASVSVSVFQDQLEFGSAQAIPHWFFSKVFNKSRSTLGSKKKKKKKKKLCAPKPPETQVGNLLREKAPRCRHRDQREYRPSGFAEIVSGQ